MSKGSSIEKDSKESLKVKESESDVKEKMLKTGSEENKSKSGSEEVIELKRERREEVDSQEKKRIDPFKDNKRFKKLKKIISHTCLLITVLSLKWVILGICAQVFYEGKSHLFIFGMICIIHLIGAPLGYMAIRYGNRIFFIIIAILNLIWILSTIVLLLYFNYIEGGADFKQEIGLHIGAVFYGSAAIVLAVTSLLMIKK